LEQRENQVIDGRVLIVGAGGLGVPAALSLARMGLATVGLIDPDPVELSNLHRQIIYGISDIGTPKAGAAARKLVELNPGVSAEPIVAALDESNAREIVARYDFVIDATDDPAAKFLINDACVRAGRAFVYGGVLAMGGQAMTVIPGRTACLRCVFEGPPEPGEIASCREAGIIGPVAGLIGLLQADEARRFVLGLEPVLAGGILTYDATGAPRVRVTRISPRRGCACTARASIGWGDAPARN
jgi:molybdopterin/thiamine biosynthesis adenylyltransferase